MSCQLFNIYCTYAAWHNNPISPPQFVIQKLDGCSVSPFPQFAAIIYLLNNLECHALMRPSLQLLWRAGGVQTFSSCTPLQWQLFSCLAALEIQMSVVCPQPSNLSNQATYKSDFGLDLTRQYIMSADQLAKPNIVVILDLLYKQANLSNQTSQKSDFSIKMTIC